MTKYDSTPVAMRSSKHASGILQYPTEVGTATENINSNGWWSWLEGTGNTRFYVDSMPYEYTARRELRRHKYYWYAYKRFNDVLYKVYMGQSDKLNSEYLFETVPRKLDDKINGKPITRK